MLACFVSSRYRRPSPCFCIRISTPTMSCELDALHGLRLIQTPCWVSADKYSENSRLPRRLCSIDCHPQLSLSAVARAAMCLAIVGRSVCAVLAEYHRLCGIGTSTLPFATVAFGSGPAGRFRRHPSDQGKISTLHVARCPRLKVSESHDRVCLPAHPMSESLL